MSISIIIPVYNAEKYLHQCLDSIATQNFEEWECILVDDGSTDLSGLICNEYAAKDSRFKVYHKDNGGVSSARNFGIERSSSEWITFVDADDFLVTNALSKIVTYAEQSHYDIISYSYHYEFDKSRVSICKAGFPFIKYSSKIYLNSYHFSPTIWSYAFKRSVIVDNRLKLNPNLRYGEDRLFIIEYINCIKGGVGIINEPLYLYRYVETSAVHNASKSNRQIKDQLDSVRLLVDFIKDNSMSYRKNRLQIWMLFIYFLSHIKHLSDNADEYEPIFKKTIRYIENKGYKDLILNYYYSHYRQALNQLDVIKKVVKFITYI